MVLHGNINLQLLIELYRIETEIIPVVPARRHLLIELYRIETRKLSQCRFIIELLIELYRIETKWRWWWMFP